MSLKAESKLLFLRFEFVTSWACQKMRQKEAWNKSITIIKIILLIKLLSEYTLLRGSYKNLEALLLL